MVDFAIVPERTALVNVDMQNCLVEDSPFSAPGGLVVLDHINRLVATCPAAGILIVHTSHVLRPDGSNTGVLGEIPPIVTQGIIAKGSKPAALHLSLVVCRADILPDKPRFGAFHCTDLELILRSRGVDTIIVTGVATNVVAKQALVKRRFVIFECCSRVTAQQHSMWGTYQQPSCKEQRAPLWDCCSLKY